MKQVISAEPIQRPQQVNHITRRRRAEYHSETAKSRFNLVIPLAKLNHRLHDEMSTSAGPEFPSPKPAGSVVLCNIGRAGDTILRNSILDSVYRTYAEVTYICGRGNIELIRSDPRHHRVHLFRNGLAGFARTLKTAWRRRYDAYIDLKDHDSSTSLLLARLFRARSKTGVNRPRNRPFQQDTNGVWVPGEHKVDVMKRIARAAGLNMGDFRPSLVCAPDSIDWFSQTIQGVEPFILVNISATHPNRMWQPDKWSEFLQMVGLPPRPILLNALPEHRDQALEICNSVKTCQLIRARHFMDVAVAVARASLVLTVNTGVLHACSALDTPIVLLANGPTELREFAPLSAKQLVIEATAPRLLPDLSAREVIEAATGRLPL